MGSCTRSLVDGAALVGVRQRLGVGSAMAVPLEVAGQRRGVPWAASPTPELFDERGLHFSEALARWMDAVASLRSDGR